MSRLNAEIPEDLKKRFKIQLLQDDTDFKDWLIERINKYLKESEGKQKSKK